MEVRAFLALPKDRRREICQCEWDIELLRQRCEHITACLEGTGQGSGDWHRDGPLAALADQKTRLRQLYAALSQQEGQVTAFLNNLPDPKQRAILKLRYVDGLHWGEIQTRMEEQGYYYSERQLYNFHRRGLELARRLWADQNILDRENVVKNSEMNDIIT